MFERPALSWQLAFWAGLLLFSLYLLSFSGRFHVMDEVAVFSVGHNLARYGDSDINQLIWTNHWTPHPPGVWGGDGNLYTKKAPGISLLVAPLIWLGHQVGVDGVHSGLLIGALTSALIGGLLVIWLMDLGIGRGVALATALGYGLATIAWVYARMIWSLPVVGLALTASAWAIWRAQARSVANASPSHTPRLDTGWLWLAGLFAALTLILRYESLLFIGLLSLYLWSLSGWRGLLRGETMGRVGIFLLPSLLAAAGLLLFNQLRFRSLVDTGYTQELLFSPSWLSLYGLTFSPGQGLFVYSPLLLLALPGAVLVQRRWGRYGLLMLGLPVAGWLFYSTWFSWGGIWNWGPRFLLTILPLLMLPVAASLQAMIRWPWGAGWLVAGILAGAGILLNLLGMLVDFNAYFSQVPSNRAFLLDWSHFAPLAHWRLFQAGQPVDLIWLSRGPEGWAVDWAGLGPALALLALASAGVIWAYRGGSRGARGFGPLMGMAGLGLLLTFLSLSGYQATAQAQRLSPGDAALLARLGEQAQPGESLLIAAPPYGDFWEMNSLLMARSPIAMPTYLWVEAGERAILAQEREWLAQSVQARRGAIWLLERWRDPLAPLSESQRWLESAAFLERSDRLPGSGDLSRYLRPADLAGAWATLPAQAHFEGDIRLTGLTLPDGDALAPGAERLGLRLHWQAEDTIQAAQPLIAFLHLLPESGGPALAQSDRLLWDPALPDRGLLRAGEGVAQGHLLRLPGDLPPGGYVLVAGLYDPQSGQRSARVDQPDDDFVYLITLQKHK